MIDSKGAAFSRTNAGYFSSVIDYGNRRDSLPLTHRIGRWYGSLPSFLVADLLRFLSTDLGNSGLGVVNFSGSGTVALEMGLAARDCLAVDTNPVAVLLTWVKTNAASLLKEIPDIHEDLRQVLNHGDFKGYVSDPSDGNLIVHKNRWIGPSVQNEIRRLIAGINSLENPISRVLIACGLVFILGDFCFIDKRCTNHYVYKSKQNCSLDHLPMRLTAEIESYLERLSILSRVKHFVVPQVVLGDSCNLPLPDASASLVFSHPPYGTCINYHAITRIQQSVLELCNLEAIRAFKGKLLEENRRRDISSGTLHRFEELTGAWIAESFRVLAPGGILLVIIGDSRNAGKLYHPHTLVISRAESLGFITRELFVWITNHKAGMHVKRKGNHIDHNYIIILEKPLR